MEESKRPGKWAGVGKFAAICAAIVLVSGGLCGINMVFGDNLNFSVLGAIGLGAGGLGLLAAGVVAILLLFTKEE